MTSSLWPEQLRITCSSSVFIHIKMFYFCLSTLHFSFFPPSFFFFFDFLTHFWEILRFKNGRPILSTPTGHFLWLRGDMDCGNTIERPLGLLCAFLYVCTRACARTCVRVCVIQCAWMCGCVGLHTSILYSMASAICHCGELTHELNRDKEQIYLKQLRYILWTTVKHSFLMNPKQWTLDVQTHIYIYKIIYIYASCRKWEKPWRTPYFLLNYYLDLELIKILVLISWHPALCIYLYLARQTPLPCPHSPHSRPGPPILRWTVGHLGQWTWNNQKEEKLQEDSPNELITIKRKKLHINWILYFCCCSKQPVHVL